MRSKTPVHKIILEEVGHGSFNPSFISNQENLAQLYSIVMFKWQGKYEFYSHAKLSILLEI